MSRVCPICACREKEVLYRQHFGNEGLFPLAGYDVAVCRACGFVYADGIPRQEVFESYYAQASKYEFNRTGGAVPDAFIRHYARLAGFLHRHLKDRKARILDVGCSTGGLLNELKSMGYSALWGIDPSEVCVRAAQELYGIEAFAGSLANFEPVVKFDLVILSAVLEHLVDFSASMQKVRALLREGGSLFIVVPDAERFNRLVGAPFQQFSIEHINYFSRRSLENLLSKFDFRVTDMRQFESKANFVPEPDIMALAVRSAGGDKAISYDNETGSRVKEYIALCCKLDGKVGEIIRRKLAGVDKFIVWGVGTHTQRLIGSRLELKKILYFVDSDKRYAGRKLEGVEIREPSGIRDGAPILISTRAFQRQIVGQIRSELGLKNRVITLY